MTKNAEYTSIGDRLRELRKLRKIPQKDIIEQLGCARSTYTHYELGYRKPDNEMLAKLANIYQTSTDYILGETDINIAPQSDVKILIESLINSGKLKWDGRTLNPEEIQKITKIIDAYLEIE